MRNVGKTVFLPFSCAAFHPPPHPLLPIVRATAYDVGGCKRPISPGNTEKCASSPSSSPYLPQVPQPVRRAGRNTNTRTRPLRPPFLPSPKSNHVLPSPRRPLGRSA